MSRPVVSDNPAEQRYEAHLGDALVGFADYRRTSSAVVLTHTEVQPAFEGRGFASTITRYALDDIRARGESVVPACSYVRQWIERHPDYTDLL
jgi:hypothetical protein